jgi:hypothetical protein
VNKGLGTSLTDSIRSDESIDALATIGDAGLDAAVSSGALDGVPILGIATGLWRAGREVRHELFVRKIIRFLSELNGLSPRQRREFVEGLEQSGKKEEFGETILLILERIDDTRKPAIIGRIMAAHVRGEITYDQGMRLAAIVGRAYSQDLDFLLRFQPGTQREMTPVADALFSAGVLRNAGMDGETLATPCRAARSMN